MLSAIHAARDSERCLAKGVCALQQCASTTNPDLLNLVMTPRRLFSHFPEPDLNEIVIYRQPCSPSAEPSVLQSKSDTGPSRNSRRKAKSEDRHYENIYAVAGLTLVNLGMLIFVRFRQTAPAQASGADQIVRARGLEIADAQGKVRASISIIPEGPARRADGSLTEHGDRIFPEAVVLRLIRPDGRPSVKIATTQQGSGLDLGGGIDPTYMVLSSEGGETSLTLTNKDGRRQVIKP